MQHAAHIIAYYQHQLKIARTADQAAKAQDGRLAYTWG
jgi:hypothetical protein